jgi:phospholipase C
MGKVRHLVVVMLENRSFDHMLGYLSGTGMAVDGVTGASNSDEAARVVRGYHLESTRVRVRPHHHHEDVLSQINGGAMDGFVRGYPSNAHVAEIMGWYDQRDVLTYDSLARQYVVCDHWFSSFPGPTWPNRFFAICGTSAGLTGNLKWIDHPTFFDLLPAGSWRYYSHDVSFLRTVERYRGHVGAPISKISAFYKACVEGTLPSVSWIDPNFTLVDVDALLNWANDDHPPADIARGQNLVARIYNHLIASPNWKDTLLVVTYDEHGGFYDHVCPPPSPGGDTAPFDKLGVRVPALVVSPWVPRGTPFNGILDHTCIARTALELFAPQRVHELSPRVSASASLVPLLSESAPRKDERRLDGLPILETAVAPIKFGVEAPMGFHSMELTESQEEIAGLKKTALDAGVPFDNL